MKIITYSCDGLNIKNIEFTGVYFGEYQFDAGKFFCVTLAYYLLDRINRNNSVHLVVPVNVQN